MNVNEYQTELKLRLDWSDMDYFKHINNVSYFRFIQAARVHFWDCIGLNEYHNRTNIGPILASCTCDFLKALQYPGTIIIRTNVEWLKNTSFCLEHIIMDENNNIAAKAKDIIVIYDFNNDTKYMIPDFIRESIEELERKKG